MASPRCGGVGGAGSPIALACCTFVFNTSEFIPVGLLSDIAEDFSASEARVGMLISVYAWVVGLMSLPLMVAVAKVNWRTVMLWLVGLFALFQGLSAVATGYWTLMAARVGVACCHSVFWGVVPPYAVAKAPEGRSATALGIIVTGSSVAMIVGLPIGRVIGLYLSWRVTFGCICAISALVLCICLAVLPRVKSYSSFTLRQVPGMLKNRMVTWIYVFVTVIVTSYFMVYSYIEPFLAQIGRYTPEEITFVLILIGFAGIVAGVLFSKLYTKHPRWFLLGSSLVMVGFTGLLEPVVSWIAVLSGLCLIGAVAETCFNLACQDALIKRGPQPSTITVATYSGFFNVGIGTGTFLGGLVTTYATIGHIGFWAVIPAVAATLISIPVMRYVVNG
ncbi:MAG: MFS transporter [Bacteroidales bacterium]|nr:MFS transporter [Bacteroidales bacterium]